MEHVIKKLTACTIYFRALCCCISISLCLISYSSASTDKPANNNVGSSAMKNQTDSAQAPQVSQHFSLEDLQRFVTNFDIAQGGTATEAGKQQGATTQVGSQTAQDSALHKKNTNNWHAPHVNFAMSTEKMVARLKEHKNLKEIGSYKDRETAKESIRQTILGNKNKILDWVNDPDERQKLRIKQRFFKEIGYKMYKNGKDPIPTDSNVVILLKESRDDKVKSFIVVGAYPR